MARPDDRPDPIQATRHALQALLARSAVDRAFRRLLLTRPREALAAELGWMPDEALDVRFIENAGDATIVLPDYVGDELPAARLHRVCGGVGAPPMVAVPRDLERLTACLVARGGPPGAG